MANSWGHRLELLDTAIKTRDVSIGELLLECSVSGCTNPPTHLACHKYVTGRAGRIGSTGRQICSGHAAQFAKTNSLPYLGPKPIAITKEKRQPLVLCLLCKKKRRDTWVVPKGVIVYRQPLRWSDPVSHVIPTGAAVCRWDRIVITNADAVKHGLLGRSRWDVNDPFITVYVGELREKVEGGEQCLR